jgi:deoxyribodipyrimidine photo-lyase
VQSKKYDPEGLFIKQYCPELKSLNAKEIHEPYRNNPDLQLDYPKPIIGLGDFRERVLAAYKSRT